MKYLIHFYYKLQSYLKLPIPIFFKKLFRVYHGNKQLDKKLLKYLNFDNGFYIDIGAYDGITQSNTFFYEKYKNWRGILIEPSKSKFLLCKKFRSKKNFFYNNACVSSRSKNKSIEMTYINLKSFSEEIVPKNFLKKHLKKYDLLRGEKVFKYRIKTKTLSYILDNCRAPKIIDFFNLDTEGSEFEILNGINFKKYKFKYILIETNNFPKLKNYLHKKNFKFIKKFNYNDYLFTQKIM